MKNIFCVLFFSGLASIQGIKAQNIISLDKTIWEYRWDKEHRDFIAFTGANTAITYSYELDDFEFCKYTIKNDTIIISTNDIWYGGKHNENPIDSIVYIYKIDRNHMCLHLLSTLLLRHYWNDWEEYSNTDETYKLCIMREDE